MTDRMGMTAASIVVAPDADGAARRAADWLTTLLRSSLSERIAVCLAGGSTPRRLYERLARDGSEALPWGRIHWFWGDERFVPPLDDRSNFGMARRAMLSLAPAANVHPVPTDSSTPDEAAQRYEAELRAFHGATKGHGSGPLFDVVLLGVGRDGHTASLFPDAPALDERALWVVAATGPDGMPRVTLTCPALEHARATAFLVAGAAKRRILEEIAMGAADSPAARLAPRDPPVWFLDAAAAARIVPSGSPTAPSRTAGHCTSGARAPCGRAETTDGHPQGPASRAVRHDARRGSSGGPVGP